MAQTLSEISKYSSPLAAALAYAAVFGWWVFPCRWRPGPDRKAPLVEHGFHDASRDSGQIELWWGHRWSEALIGIATGPSGLAVLDVDIKEPNKYGPDSLDDLGHAILPATPIAHTASGGWHHYFAAGDLDIPSTTGTLGPGLDVRARGGYIIASSPGSGYSWDPHCNFDTLPLAPAPAWLIPPAPEMVTPAKPVRPCDGLSPYADAAIERACLDIRNAPDGQQRVTLRDQSFSIGTLAGAGGIPESFARAALIDAGCGMRNYDPHHRWVRKEIERIVNGAFDAGVVRPRPTIGRRAA